MADTPKKKIIDDVTKVGSNFLQPVFGGDTTAPPDDPNNIGHLHDGKDRWGSSSKINLSQHTIDRLVLQDAYSVAKSVSAYPSMVLPATNILSGTFLNVNNSQLKSAGNLNGTLPFQKLDGYFNSTFGVSNLTIQPSPFTIPGILASALWYFSLPLDMDITKTAYFSFNWVGDILTTDGSGNTIFDSSKLNTLGQPAAQTTTFRITWQWYSPGYAIFPPAVIYDGYTPANIIGTNINQNSLTRGRISNLTVNDFPFRMLTNDSSTSAPNYVNLTGLSQVSNANLLGIQVDVLSSGYLNTALGTLSGHINFMQGNMIYLSRTLGSANTAFKTL